MRAAVFLDRDDTLIANRAIRDRMEHPGYLYRPELVELLPGAAEGCALLKRAGFGLVIVTNQSAVARGWCRVEDVVATNTRTLELISERAGAGVEIDAVYTCLHCPPPDGVVSPYNTEHPSRKPAPGLLLAAAADYGIDMARSWMIGDADRDVQAALRAGIDVGRTIVVGDREVERVGHRARDVREAAEWILTEMPKGTT